MNNKKPFWYFSSIWLPDLLWSYCHVLFSKFYYLKGHYCCTKQTKIDLSLFNPYWCSLFLLAKICTHLKKISSCPQCSLLLLLVVICWQWILSIFVYLDKSFFCPVNTCIFTGDRILAFRIVKMSFCYFHFHYRFHDYFLLQSRLWSCSCSLVGDK